MTLSARLSAGIMITTRRIMVAEIHMLQTTAILVSMTRMELTTRIVRLLRFLVFQRS